MSLFEMVRQGLSFSRSSCLVKKSPVFCGWVTLAAGTLGLILTSPGQTYVVSIFTDYFITDLGLSRSLVSLLYTVILSGAC